MTVPPHPKLYHIVHHDKLHSIIGEGYLYSDAELAARENIVGTTIGIGNIKSRRLHSELSSHPGLMVGQCVPFYFCPRSVMLYLIYQANHPDLAYKGGQVPIVATGLARGHRMVVERGILFGYRTGRCAAVPVPQRWARPAGREGRRMVSWLGR